MKKATKQELRAELKQRRKIGAQMSNICHNWSQGKKAVLDWEDRQLLEEMRVAWDAIEWAVQP